MKASTKGGGSGPRPIPDADGYVAKNIMCVDLGTHEETFKGVPKKLRKVYFCFELFGDNAKAVFDPSKGEQPFVISETFTFSLSEKANLRKFIESWRGKKIEELSAGKEELDVFTELKGKWAFINVVHAKSKKDPSKTYANIGSISPVPKVLQASVKGKQSVNELIIFELEDVSTHENFNKLPKWIQEKINSCDEMKNNPFEEDTQEVQAGMDLPDPNAPDEF